MSEYTNLLVEKEEDIAVVTLNRPKALNALNDELMTEIGTAFKELNQDHEVKVIILTGAGEKSFVAGADIKEMKDLNSDEGKRWAEKSEGIFLKIEQGEKPVIAAVNGFALGGGCEIAMACDIRIASENAKFGQPEVGLGIIPGFGGTQRLSRLVGAGMAKHLIYTAEMIKADEAYRIGLVQKIVPQENLMEEAKKIAKTIAQKSQTAVCYAKDAINRGAEMSMANAMEYESYIFGSCFSGDDQKEGMTAFVNKSKPQFTGHFSKH
jgi:enoyl-CoA hydratase